MATQLFPFANIVAGILIFIVGFMIHWVGQIISLINWDFAARIGIAEKNMIPEFKVYERGIAAADAMIGWIYGIAAVGLILNAQWAYKLAWIPGVIMVYHGLSFWFWVGNQNKAGYPINSKGLRIGWSLANLVTGVLAILVAW
ncbi:hypothetical protein ACFLWY_05275 [Chloroflexota bacterium]